MIEEAMNYLQCITSPLTISGVQILSESEGNGRVFVVIPKDQSEYGALIGEKGGHADAIRSLMRAWSGVHTGSALRINVLIPNPDKINVEYV